MQRYLIVRIPLNESDPPDMIDMIDRNKIMLTSMISSRYENIELAIEESERV